MAYEIFEIFEILSQEEIINEVRLMNSVGDSSKIYVLVEGKTDIKFMKRFISNGALIRQVPGGRHNLESILFEEYMTSKNIIAICDMDYGLEFQNNRCFTYSYNSLETMIFSENVCLYSFLDTHYFGGIKKNVIKYNILNTLTLISILRNINWFENLGLNFNKLSLSKIINIKTYSLNLAELSNQLVLRSNTNFDKVSELLYRVQQLYIRLYFSEEDLLYITNGHDLIETIKIFIESFCKTYRPSEYYSDLLLTLYTKEVFLKSPLYNNILNYVQTNGLAHVELFAKI